MVNSSKTIKIITVKEDKIRFIDYLKQHKLSREETRVVIVNEDYTIKRKFENDYLEKNNYYILIPKQLWLKVLLFFNIKPRNQPQTIDIRWILLNKEGQLLARRLKEQHNNPYLFNEYITFLKIARTPKKGKKQLKANAQLTTIAVNIIDYLTENITDKELTLIKKSVKEVKDKIKLGNLPK